MNDYDHADALRFRAEADHLQKQVIALRARVAELERERDWLSSIVENVEMTELVFAVDKAKALGAQEPSQSAEEKLAKIPWSAIGLAVAMFNGYTYPSNLVEKAGRELTEWYKQEGPSDVPDFFRAL